MREKSSSVVSLLYLLILVQNGCLWSLDGGCFHGESKLDPHLFCNLPDLKIFHGCMRQEMKRGEKRERVTLKPLVTSGHTSILFTWPWQKQPLKMDHTPGTSERKNTFWWKPVYHDLSYCSKSEAVRDCQLGSKPRSPTLQIYIYIYITV